jgi:hypothetical protein
MYLLSKTPNRQNKYRTSPWHLIVKVLSTEIRERISKSAGEKSQITYNGKPIRITANFSTETLKASRAGNENFKY